ncbi:MAG: fae [candidate division NC10 bacterium]|nr:fae [candidate division NC10 bacterium]
MREIMVGESLVGDGNEVAHIDLMIGPKNGPVGAAFASRLAEQTADRRPQWPVGGPGAECPGEALDGHVQ